MSLLDQLWDDTVAGPCPDSGLGKLRKRSTSFGFRSNNSSKEEILMDRNAARSVGENVSEDNEVRVTRSIMIMKQPPQIGDQTAGGCTPPASPAAGSTPPVSPLSGGGGGAFRFRRRSTSDAYEKASGVGSRSPCPSYDM